MMIALSLSLLVATSDVSPTADSRDDSDSPTPAEGAALGAAVLTAASGVAMFGAIVATLQTPEGADALLDARQAAGPLPAVAAIALVSIGSSALGAGAGHAAAGGELLETPAVMGAAMLGAALGSALGAAPAALAFAASDATLARTPTNIGDAIGTGVAAGLAETIGIMSSTGAGIFVAPPAGAVGAFIAANALDDDLDDSVD